MGGLGPGIGGLELLVIGLVALLVVGPKDLPVMLRRLGQMTARARNMAAEFRASFDEMARQSELDELRKEVEALRNATPVKTLTGDADAAFREIRDGLNAPVKPAPALEAPEGPAMTPLPGPVAATDTPPALESPSAPDPEPTPKRKRSPAKPKAATNGAALKPPAKKAPPKRTKKVEL